MYIAVGFPGSIYTSNDASSWTAQTSGVSVSLSRVAFGAGLIVVVGDVGTIITSSDGGVTWTPRTSGTSEFLNDVTWTGSVFIAVGNNGTAIYSPDGITWSALPIVTSNNLNGVIYGAGTYVIVGRVNNITAAIYTSPDLVTWTFSDGGIGRDLTAITYDAGLGLFVVCGRLGKIATSPDATTWTVRTSGTSNTLYAATSDGSGNLVVAGDVGTLLTSSNGTSWPTRTSLAPDVILGLGYGNGIFLEAGTVNFIGTSSDGGATWTDHSQPGTDFGGVAYGTTTVTVTSQSIFDDEFVNYLSSFNYEYGVILAQQRNINYESYQNIEYTFTILYETELCVPTVPSDFLFQLLPELYKIVDASQGQNVLYTLLVSVMGSFFEDAINSIESFATIFNFEKCDPRYLDHLLYQLGNPFDISGFSDNDKRKIISLLVQIYKQKGTKQGMINATRVLTNLDVDIKEDLKEYYWNIGISSLDQPANLFPVTFNRVTVFRRATMNYEYGPGISRGAIVNYEADRLTSGFSEETFGDMVFANGGFGGL